MGVGSRPKRALALDEAWGREFAATKPNLDGAIVGAHLHQLDGTKAMWKPVTAWPAGTSASLGPRVWTLERTFAGCRSHSQINSDDNESSNSSEEATDRCNRGHNAYANPHFQLHAEADGNASDNNCTDHHCDVRCPAGSGFMRPGYRNRLPAGPTHRCIAGHRFAAHWAGLRVIHVAHHSGRCRKPPGAPNPLDPAACSRGPLTRRDYGARDRAVPSAAFDCSDF